MPGEYPVEDQGYTLHCDTCGQQVRSNEMHTCPKASGEEEPVAGERKLTMKEKAEFVRYVKSRRIDYEVGVNHDQPIMNDAVGRLPADPSKLTDKRAVMIMRLIEDCELRFVDDEKGVEDEKWLQFFFS